MTKPEKKSEQSLFNFHFSTARSDVFLKRRKTEGESNLTRFCNLRHRAFNDLACLILRQPKEEYPAKRVTLENLYVKREKKMMYV